MLCRISLLFTFMITLFIAVFFASCNSHNSERKEEQIRISTDSTGVQETPGDSNSIQGNMTFTQVATFPNSVILTGLQDHRLVTIYKVRAAANSIAEKILYSNKEDEEGETDERFIPGIDILYGFNLLNIAHYNLKTEKLNFLFNYPVLIKTLYYPSLIPDSIDKKPVQRDYYLSSVYDEDTNKDSLINKKDLRKFYYFDRECNAKIPLLPAGYSAIRSQYDSRNDVMYIFAQHDDNKNGMAEKKEPTHIFWVDMKSPVKAKRMY